MTPPAPRVLAHRGAHAPIDADARGGGAAVSADRGAGTGAVGENTCEAFRRAAALGTDGVELDVRLTADGALVVVHDAVVEGVGAVAASRRAELPRSIPELDEALDACAGLTLVNVEMKDLPGEAGSRDDRKVATSLAAALAARAAHGGPPASPAILVSSFDLAALDVYRGADPTTPTGWLVLAADEAAALDGVATAHRHGHHALHPFHPAVTPAVVAAAHGAGLQVAAWTVNDPERAGALAGAGVDVLITDVPAALLALLRRRA